MQVCGLHFEWILLFNQKEESFCFTSLKTRQSKSFHVLSTRQSFVLAINFCENMVLEKLLRNNIDVTVLFYLNSDLKHSGCHLLFYVDGASQFHCSAAVLSLPCVPVPSPELCWCHIDVTPLPLEFLITVGSASPEVDPGPCARTDQRGEEKARPLPSPKTA